MIEEKVKKRGWIKNVAIIFLSVLLVLTFFSNTIMNHSLPEVSAQYVTLSLIHIWNNQIKLEIEVHKIMEELA